MILNLTTNENITNMRELNISNMHPDRRVTLKDMFNKLGRNGIPAIVQLLEEEFSAIELDMPELTTVKEVVVDFKYPFVYTLTKALTEGGWKVMALNTPFGKTSL